MKSIQHRLQQVDPGIVWLDTKNIITGMNELAEKTLGDHAGRLIGKEVLQIHPEESWEQVRFLFDHAARPGEDRPAATMTINIPHRVLLITVAKMCGSGGDPMGSCMIFYDVTGVSGEAADGDDPSGRPDPASLFGRQLFKLPVHKDKQVLLVDLEKVACIKAEGHYSTLYVEDETYLCNLSLSDLEDRICSTHFVRVHRSYLVNVRYAKAFEKSNDQCLLILDHADGLRVPISRPNVARLKSLLGLD